MGRLTRERGIRARSLGSGFTLIEVMVALAVLAVGLIGMLGLQLQAMRKAEWGRHSSEAARVVGDQLEMFNRLDWNDPLLQPTGWTLPVAVTRTVQTQAGTLQQQLFNVQWRITNDPTDPNLRSVDVRALWTEDDQAAAAPPRRYAASSIRYNY